MSLCRRQFLAASAACLLGRAPSIAKPRTSAAALDDKALIAITLDLEMSRNFPTWEQTHWDYEKGNLNAETKKYAALACRRVKAQGGVIHCFAVGRVLEQENVDWLKEGLAKDGLSAIRSKPGPSASLRRRHEPRRASAIG
jgi:hypothetical protein